MHIAQIEIDQFKSFAQRTVLPFEPGFTAISGPNGSGKSNIIDSVLFCLGLSSSRTLRAEKLSDLINNTARRREASVTLTLRHSEPIAVATPPPDGQDPTLMTISRRIRESSGGFSSVYTLNGRTTTLTEIHEVLSQYHISPGCYNVMMQGDVSAIVTMSANERRKILDELAGVAEFDRKIEQAERELDTTRQTLDHHRILLGEVDDRLAQLSTERETALRYQALKDERTAQQGKLTLVKFAALLREQEALNQKVAQAQARERDARQAIDAHQATLADARSRLDQLQEAVRRQGEDEHIALRRQIESLKGHLDRKQDAARRAEVQMAENAALIDQMTREIARQQELHATLAEELAGYQHQLAEVEALFKEEKARYDNLNHEFDALTDRTGSVSLQRADLRAQLEAAEDALSDAQRRLLDTEAAQRRLEADAEQARLQADSHHQQRETLTAQLAAADTRLAQAQVEQTHRQERLHAAQRQVSEGRVALQNAQGAFQTAQRTVLMLEAQQKAMEEVTFGRAVDTVLQSGMSGVHGTIAQLCKPASEDLALALEIALGGRIQNLVVDDDRVAQQGIALLQRSRAGRATFLPLSQIQRSRPLPALPRGSGIVDFALNLVDFDYEYQDVFAFALGETLIVEDLDAARPLMRQYRMVTRDGSLLERSGAMTGGSAGRGGTARFLTSNRAEEDALAEARQRMERAEADREAAQKRLTQLELQLDRLKTDTSEAASTLAALEADRNALARQLAALPEPTPTDTLPMADPAVTAEALSQLQERIPQLTGDRDRLKAELAALEANLPTEALDQLRQAVSEAKFQMDYYESQCRNIQADIKEKTLEQSHHTVRITHCEERIVQAHAQTAELKATQAADLEEATLTRQQVDALEAQTQALDAELRKLQAERDAAQKALLELEKAHLGLERQATQAAEQVQSLQAKRRELQPAIQTHRITLVNGGVEDPEAAAQGTLPSENQVQNALQRLEQEMAALEPVNMRAIQAYDEVAERRTELSDQIETLNREQETIEGRIGDTQSLKLAAFRTTFEAVDTHFKAIFAELADGAGSLSLTQPDAPFAGGLTLLAQPRGKKMQRLEAMSGGEKSLTSLAFVFALQRTMPAPFYALDEVDMNLDGVNAEKLAQMVTREAQRAQFVVVSLRKPMLDQSDRILGVTQRRDGVTRITGIRQRDNVEVPV